MTDVNPGMAVSPSAFFDPRHAALYQYWLDKKGARPMPARRDFEPSDFPSLLPNLFIFDVLYDPRDYVLRLLGTNLVAVLGRDYTGAHFDEMYQGATAATLREQYDWVVDHKEPVYDRLDASWMEKDYISYERLLLPLSSEGDKVDKLLGCALFLGAAELAARREDASPD